MFTIFTIWYPPTSTRDLSSLACLRILVKPGPLKAPKEVCSWQEGSLSGLLQVFGSARPILSGLSYRPPMGATYNNYHDALTYHANLGAYIKKLNHDGSTVSTRLSFQYQASVSPCRLRVERASLDRALYVQSEKQVLIYYFFYFSQLGDTFRPCNTCEWAEQVKFTQSLQVLYNRLQVCSNSILAYK